MDRDFSLYSIFGDSLTHHQAFSPSLFVSASGEFRIKGYSLIIRFDYLYNKYVLYIISDQGEQILAGISVSNVEHKSFFRKGHGHMN